MPAAAVLPFGLVMSTCVEAGLARVLSLAGNARTGFRRPRVRSGDARGAEELFRRSEPVIRTEVRCRANASNSARIIGGRLIPSRVGPYDSSRASPFTEENDGG